MAFSAFQSSRKGRGGLESFPGATRLSLIFTGTDQHGGVRRLAQGGMALRCLNLIRPVKRRAFFMPERKRIVDGVPIIYTDKLPEQRPSLLFEWDLHDRSCKPLRTRSKLCEECAQPLPCRWCSMAREWNLDEL